jgi:phosphatidylglycerol:prolipoprotein diacylglycerol transferase
MWPYVIEQPFRIGTYGVMMAMGFLTALWLMNRDMPRRNIDPKVGETTVFLGIIAGVLGAKLAYMLTEAPEFHLSDLVSGAGLTWHGGFILAASLIIGYYVWKKLPVLVMLDAVAPMLASGYAFGRLGCQVSGDGDYGIACGELVNRAACFNFPGYRFGFEACLAQGFPGFCMNYPDGIVPTTQLVHPTPIYEAINNFMLFGFLWLIRDKIKRPGALFVLYLVISGLLRFGIEFIRQDEARPIRFLDLRDAQLVALAQIALGVAMFVWAQLRTLPANEEYGILKVSPMPAVPPEPRKKQSKKR